MNKVAKEAEVHKDVVNDLVAFFYAKFRKNLSELKEPKMNLPGLGTFSIRKKKLRKSNKKKQRYFRKFRKDDIFRL